MCRSSSLCEWPLGLAIEESDRNARHEFYKRCRASTYMASTPTLCFNGRQPCGPQLSSCLSDYVPDELFAAFTTRIHDNAMLSKFAGGLGKRLEPTCDVTEAPTSKGHPTQIPGCLCPLESWSTTPRLHVNQGGQAQRARVRLSWKPGNLDIEEFPQLRQRTPATDRRRRTPRHEHRQLDSSTCS